MRQANSHPNFETLKAFGSGQVVGAAARKINQHLATCAECRRAVEDATIIGRVERPEEVATLVETAEPDRNGSIKRADDIESHVAPTFLPPIAEKNTRPVPQPAAAEQIPAALAASPEYEVIREISRGGMGVVYLARNRRMYRLEALKVVNQDLLKHSGALERFEREMQSAARLSHSNIVIAYSSPPLDGLLAFAMEFVDGIDLYGLVQARGPLPVSNACYYVYQAAQGLQHAHDRQMVHRDIKPNNLMLTRDGKKQLIKILDFGLAKATSENATGADLTGTGQMLGTPRYMAPEQIVNAAKADIRADIYGLGCTMYYLLTGHAPFPDGESLYAILHAHQTEIARPLHEVRPDVPVELAEIVAKMIAKDPAQRYQIPAEVSQALAPFFKRGVRPIPPGTARFAAPPAPVAPAPVPHPTDAPGDRANEPNPMQSMLDFVAEPVPGRPAQQSQRGGQRITSFRAIPPKIHIAVAAAIALLVGLGLWANGVFSDKAVQNNSISSPDSARGNEGGKSRQKNMQGDHAGEERDNNGLKLRLIWCPPGNFTMGSRKSEAERDFDEDQVDVLLTKGFWLGKYEITQGQWKQVMQTTPWRENGKARDKVKDGDDCPVTYVSWEQATEFLEKLTRQERAAGRLDDREEYTLPTEAQWEYACRAGAKTTTKFAFGDDDLALADYAWFARNALDIGERYAHEVGRKKSNDWGLHDMHGNVWEWCLDVYRPELPGGADPMIASGGSPRVVRGGAWYDAPRYCRSADRSKVPPSRGEFLIGFRAALTVGSE